jgi:hypothetical protein
MTRFVTLTDGEKILMTYCIHFFLTKSYASEPEDFRKFQTLLASHLMVSHFTLLLITLYLEDTARGTEQNITMIHMAATAFDQRAKQ